MVTATAAWLDETEMEAWEAFLRASIRLMDRLDAELDGHGLSLADYEILVHLSGEATGELRMTELAARTLVSRSGLTRRLDRLSTPGWWSGATARPTGGACSPCSPTPAAGACRRPPPPTWRACAATSSPSWKARICRRSPPP
ncbi:MAG TPA: helix-turn-helix domain-containing protein [Acidimicrobiales bacterium]|nr:helix-turn-helix domain-containing protein [Acidimicrobiales bacterium]